MAELAGRQHGVVSGTQLIELGYSEDAIWRDCAAGRLHRLHRNVYAVGHGAVSRHGLAYAAVLAVGSEGLLSHRSAAWLWGLTSRWQAPVEVTARSPRNHPRGIRVHSAEALRPEDRDECEDIPVTAIPRTLLDFAAVDPTYLSSALGAAERRGLLELGAVERFIERSRGFRGVARLRAALAAYRSPGFTRSMLERRFLTLVTETGLPTPKVNLFIEGYEIDMFWPKERFAVELDTFDYHGDRVAFESDRLRQAKLKLAGIEMIRVTGNRLDREPRAVMRELGQHLAMRRNDLGLPPR